MTCEKMIRTLETSKTVDELKEKEFINELINHIHEFGYWMDCKVYYGNKCWSTYDIAFFGEAATLIEKRGDVYVSSIQNGLENNSIIIKLVDRMGGLIYTDLYEPKLSELSCKAQRYMREHKNKHYYYGYPDGEVALLALEEFLFTHNKIIVDITSNEYSDVIITIEDDIDNNARRMMKQEEI